MAVNIAPGYTLEEWRSWLHQYTERPLVWAQDMEGQAIAAFGVYTLGTKVIVDRQGRITYRSAGTAGYDALAEAVRQAL